MNAQTVSGLARQFGIPPRRISDLFYARKLDDSACPVVDGRRLIPLEYVPAVEMALQNSGILAKPEARTNV